MQSQRRVLQYLSFFAVFLLGGSLLTISHAADPKADCPPGQVKKGDSKNWKCEAAPAPTAAPTAAPAAEVQNFTHRDPPDFKCWDPCDFMKAGPPNFT